MILRFLKRLLYAPPKRIPPVRLDAQAAAMTFHDAEVAHCWELVREGIRTQKIGLGNLEPWIAHLRAGNGMAADEFSIEIEEPPAVGRIAVQLLDDARTCPAPLMIEALERLRKEGERRESS